jgi:hypothetical protein
MLRHCRSTTSVVIGAVAKPQQQRRSLQLHQLQILRSSHHQQYLRLFSSNTDSNSSSSSSSSAVVEDKKDDLNHHINNNDNPTTTPPSVPSQPLSSTSTVTPTYRRAVIPGAHNMYGSLQDIGHRTSRSGGEGTGGALLKGGIIGGGGIGGIGFSPNHRSDHLDGPGEAPVASWQAADNADVQRVTVKAMIYELIHQQTATIEQTVPWFLETMPGSYFRQVPEWLRMEHIKAIAAVKDANMDLYLNLSTHLPDGRQVLTFIRPGTEAGTLLRMVQELPENSKYDADTPLSRLHVFSTNDGTMSLNIFIYGRPNPSLTSLEYIHDVGLPILQYASDVQAGILHEDNHDQIDQLHPSPLLESNVLEQYMRYCTETYIRIGADDPKRFLQQRQIIDHVAGKDGTSVHIAASNREHGYYWVDFAVANSLPQGMCFF